MGLLKEFKEFISRGNVMDLAVGVIIGGAFTAIVNSLVNDIINPLISILTGGTEQVSGMSVVFNGVEIKFGNFLGAIISFLITAAVLFAIIKAFNNAQKLAKLVPGVGGKEEEAAPEPRVCPYCKQEIADDATRCPHCTSVLPGFDGDF